MTIILVRKQTMLSEYVGEKIGYVHNGIGALF